MPSPPRSEPYVFVIMDLGTRRILHHNVTAHPTAEWTLQQFREALPGEHAYRFLIHDLDSIFSKELHEEVTAMGVRVLKTPVRAPKANSFCERFGGTMRRECLDFVIPFNERHLRLVLKMWIGHFNQGDYVRCGGAPRVLNGCPERLLSERIIRSRQDSLMLRPKRSAYAFRFGDRAGSFTEFTPASVSMLRNSAVNNEARS